MIEVTSRMRKCLKPDLAISRAASYRRLRSLATGGMGRVDLAVRREATFFRLFAIKRLHEQLRLVRFSKHHDVRLDLLQLLPRAFPKIRRHFARESKTTTPPDATR